MSDETGMPPEPVYCLFSGGKDSFVAASVLQDSNHLLGCIAIDTGIAVPEWQSAIMRICAQQGWSLEIIPTSVRYEWLVWRYGFPGYLGHGSAMNYLKGRAIREFKRKYPGIALGSGARRAESDRRAMTTKPVSDFEGVTVYAPIYEWETARVWEYAKSHGYERPAVYSKLGISGDCLCGAFAKEFERDALRVHYPDVDARISRCERIAHCPSRPWGWANRKQPRAKQGAEAFVCAECGDVEDTLREEGRGDE